MGLFRKLFSKKEEITTNNINEVLNLGEYFYFMTYEEHYQEFLNGLTNKNKVISELFVFRGWTTQLGFRIFSSKPDISERIIGEIFNQGKLGKKLLAQLEHVDIEKETGEEYIDLVDNRWQIYDAEFINNKTDENPIPTLQICSKLSDFCNINDPLKLALISIDFFKHLDKIKDDAIKCGLFK